MLKFSGKVKILSFLFLIVFLFHSPAISQNIFLEKGMTGMGLSGVVIKKDTFQGTSFSFGIAAANFDFGLGFAKVESEDTNGGTEVISTIAPFFGYYNTDDGKSIARWGGMVSFEPKLRIISVGTTILFIQKRKDLMVLPELGFIYSISWKKREAVLGGGETTDINVLTSGALALNFVLHPGPNVYLIFDPGLIIDRFGTYYLIGGGIIIASKG